MILQMMAVHEIKPAASESSHELLLKLEKDKDEEQQEDSVHVYPFNKQSSMNAALYTRELWKQFDTLGTEMIVTRRGR